MTTESQLTSQVTELLEADFDSKVLHSPATVLIKFGTEWCPPCKALEPTLHQLAADHPQILKIFTVDTEKSQSLARTHNITSVPTLLIYRHGQQLHRIQGLLPKRLLLEKLNLPTP